MTNVILDAIGDRFFIEKKPQKVISLVPSITETLIDLGLQDQVVAKTNYCIHPHEKVKDIPNIGGTKNFDIQKVINLKPDLVIANHEENTKDQILELKKHCKVFVTKIDQVEDVNPMILNLGRLTHSSLKATEIIIKIKSHLNRVKSHKFNKKQVAYFIWRNPYMICAADTYINSVLKLYGFENTFKHLDRYPEVKLEDIGSGYIFLSSEPYPFKEKHLQEISKITRLKTILVDGEDFSWFGSRLTHSLDSLLKFRMQLS
ncbi:MAG: ABC transporter substrate-binding protein [Candidatus Cloacimonetes bacterium]|nr:ABC transporter substrate-binding protein [Candidatus Cloacimonadota bacterium]